MRKYDERLKWRGKTYASVYGFADAVAKDKGIDPQVAEDAAAYVEAACESEQCDKRATVIVDEDDLDAAIEIFKARQESKGAVNAGDCVGCPYFDEDQVVCKASKEPSTCGYAGLHGYGSGIV